MVATPTVVTLTPSPAFDRTYVLESLVPGEVHRAHEVRSELAGKGVNATHNLRISGISSIAVLPMKQEEASVNGRDQIRVYPVEAATRINITVLDHAGQTTKINEVASPLSSNQWSGLCEMALALSQESSNPWLLLAGTIPNDPSGNPLAVRTLFEQASVRGIRVGLDTSGSALFELARSGLPDVIKPNAPELAECVGRSLRTIGDVVTAAHEVYEWGVTHVLVSLGPDGMVGVSSSGAVHASTPPVTVRNTIGAGDASVAGFLSHFVSHPDQFAESVEVAVAWGALKVQEVSSQLQSLEGLPEVSISTSPDLNRDLQEPGLI